MKISLNWLKDYVSIGLSSEQLIHKLTMAGLEVEKVHSIGDDTVFELEITPNRPDCLNTIGIAREISAILNKPLKLPKIKLSKFPKGKCSVDVLDKQGCPRYVGTCIENVIIGQTPKNIKERIEALGMRSINNVVDITNFVLMEFGQPLHAFDYDKLIGGKLIVRRAKDGEKIVTIDGVERKLDSSILVIADEKRPVAIAGIMGGKETEVTNSTKNIILESAYFDPILIRRAGRKLGLSSDSSYRFERGVSFDGVLTGADRATSLVLDNTGGKAQRRADIVVSQKTKTNPVISISLKEINSYLGSDLKIVQCKNILEKLGFKVKAQKENLKVRPPSFRNDIKYTVDIIEEVARVIGYDNLPLSLPQIKTSSVVPSAKRKTKNILRDILITQGFDEAITYAMIDQKSVDKTKLNMQAGIKIQNPLSLEQEMMRPVVLPSLLSVVQTNLNRGQKNFKLFEIGKIYTVGQEHEMAGLILTGISSGDWRGAKKQDVDYYDVKGAVEQILRAFKVEDVVFQPQDYPVFENGQSVDAVKDGKNIAIIGKVAVDVLNSWDIKQKNIWFAFINLEHVYAFPKKINRYEPFSEFPPVVRDVSLAVKKEVAFEEIKKIANRHAAAILSSIHFNEEYTGDKIPSGQRGLVFSLVYQSKERTLREDEVSSAHQKILQAFSQELGAIVR